MIITSLKKPIALSLSCLFLASNVVLAHAAESNVWSDRKNSLLAYALPLNSPAPFSPRLSRPLSSTMRIQERPSQKSHAPSVWIVQDVHANLEAQKNIAQAVESLISISTGSLVIGIEGVKGPFDFTRFRAFPDKTVTRKVGDHLLKTNRISAPSYVGLTHEGPLPLMIGVDDPTLYKANVQAYLESTQRKPQEELVWNKKDAELATRKKLVFSSNLMKFDESRASYRSGKTSLAQYLGQIIGKGQGPLMRKDLATFLEASRLESSLNFEKANQEKEKAMAGLVPLLSPIEINELTNLNHQFIAGELSHVDFHKHIENLALIHHTHAAWGPHLKEYLAYLEYAEKIKSDNLMEDIQSLEDDISQGLCQTDAEKILLVESEHHHLVRKLLDFGLTPREWQDYKQGISPSATTLAPFEAFYRLADLRSERMVRNLLDAMKGPKKSALLIAGGFHTHLIVEGLEREGVSCSVMSPKITKFDTDQGASYLTAFAREKTPLEKLLQGEKLFLANSGTCLGHPKSSGFVTNLSLVLLATWNSLCPPQSGVNAKSEGNGSKLITLVREKISFETSPNKKMSALSETVGSLGTIYISRKIDATAALLISISILEEAVRWGSLEVSGITFTTLMATALIHALLHVLGDIRDFGFKGMVVRLPIRLSLSFFLFGTPYLLGDWMQSDSLGILLASAMHIFSNVVLHPWFTSKGIIWPKMSLVKTNETETTAWEKHFIEQWGKPSDSDLEKAEVFIQNTIQENLLDGRNFTDGLGSADPDYFKKSSERSRLLQALFYLEPDFVGGILVTFNTHHGHWREMIAPKHGSHVHSGINPSMVGEMIDRALSFYKGDPNLDTARLSLRSNSNLTLGLSKTGITRLFDFYLEFSTAKIIFDKLSERNREVLRSLLKIQGLSRFTKNLTGKAEPIQMPSQNEIIRSGEVAYAILNLLRQTGEIDFPSILADQINYENKVKILRAFLLGPSEYSHQNFIELAGALLASIKPEQVERWREMLIEDERNTLELPVLVIAVRWAWAIIEGLQPTCDGESINIHPNRQGFLSFLKAIPWQLRNNVLIGVNDSNLTRAVTEVDKPVGHIKYGRRFGPLYVIESDNPTLDEVMQAPKNSILAMSTLPTSDVGVGPFQVIMTFRDADEGNHAMERAYEWEAPFASVPRDQILKIVEYLRLLPENERLVAFEVIDKNKVELRVATKEEIKDYKKFPEEPETIHLPEADPTAGIDYLPPQDIRLRNELYVGPKVAHLNWLQSQIPLTEEPFHGPFHRTEIAGGSSFPFSAFWRILELNIKTEKFEDLIEELEKASTPRVALMKLNAIQKLIKNLEFNFPKDSFWNNGNLAQLFNSYWKSGVFIRDCTNAQNIRGFPGFGAGLYLTEPNVLGKEAFWLAVKDVWADVWSKSPFAQRRRHHVKESTLYPGIWLSPSRPVDFAFVIHTSNTLMEDDQHLTMSVVQGLGISIVSDDAEYDGLSTRVDVNKSDLSLKVEKSTKEFKATLVDIGNLRAEPVDHDQDFENHPQFKYLTEQLAKISIEVEKITGLPQKIEGTLYFDASSDQWVITFDQSDPFVRQTSNLKLTSRVGDEPLSPPSPGIFPFGWQWFVKILSVRLSPRWVFGIVGGIEEVWVSGALVVGGSFAIKSIWGLEALPLGWTSLVVGGLFVLIHTLGPLYSIRDNNIARAPPRMVDIVGIAFISITVRLLLWGFFPASPTFSFDTVLKIGLLIFAAAFLHGPVYNSLLGPFLKISSAMVPSLFSQGIESHYYSLPVVLQHAKPQETIKEYESEFDYEGIKDSIALLRKKGKLTSEEIGQAVSLFSETIRRIIADESTDSLIKAYIGGPPTPTQIEAALHLLKNKTIVGMLPSEGKTLTVGLAAFLHILQGEKVEVHDWNDELAGRNAQVIGAILDRMGFKVGTFYKGRFYSTTQEKNDESKLFLRAYSGGLLAGARSCFSECDLVYGPFDQMIFVWMHDLFSLDDDPIHQKTPVFLIEEADTPLIDERNDPLIISKPGKVLERSKPNRESAKRRTEGAADMLLDIYDFFKMKLKEDETFSLLLYAPSDERDKVFEPLAKEIDAKYPSLKDRAKLKVLFESPLTALYKLENGRDYIDLNDEVVLIDETTGALKLDKKISQAIHTFLELKERDRQRKEKGTPDQATEGEVIPHQMSSSMGQMMIRIFYRMAPFVSGVIGEKNGEAQSLLKALYDFDLVDIPAKQKENRRVFPNRYFATTEAKWDAIVKSIRPFQEAGLPILINTQDIKESHDLARVLSEAGLISRVITPIDLINGSKDWNKMGDPGAITIVPKVAGRGHEIKMAPSELRMRAVEGYEGEFGGLLVVGTYRNMSEREELQLIKRAARRGQPGTAMIFDHYYSEFLQKYLSEDISNLVVKVDFDTNELIEDSPRAVDKLVDRARQERIDRLLALDKEQNSRYKEIIEAHLQHVPYLRDQVASAIDKKKIQLKDSMEEFTDQLFQSIEWNKPMDFYRLLKRTVKSTLGFRKDNPLLPRQNETLGERLLRMRIYFGLTTEEVAKEIGTSSELYKSWEENEDIPSAFEIEKLIELYAGLYGGNRSAAVSMMELKAFGSIKFNAIIEAIRFLSFKESIFLIRVFFGINKLDFRSFRDEYRFLESAEGRGSEKEFKKIIPFLLQPLNTKLEKNIIARILLSKLDEEIKTTSDSALPSKNKHIGIPGLLNELDLFEGLKFLWQVYGLTQSSAPKLREVLMNVSNRTPGPEILKKALGPVMDQDPINGDILFKIVSEKAEAETLKRNQEKIRTPITAKAPAVLLLGAGQDPWSQWVMMGLMMGLMTYQILHPHFSRQRMMATGRSNLSLRLNRFSFEKYSLNTGLDQVVVVPAAETIDGILGEIITLLNVLPKNDNGEKPLIRVLLTGDRESFRAEISERFPTTLQSNLKVEGDIEKEILSEAIGKKMLFVIPNGTDLTGEFFEALDHLSSKEIYKNNIQILMLEHILKGTPGVLGTTQSLLNQLKNNSRTLSHA